MKIVSSDAMKALDKAVIELDHIPSLELMEHAGAAVADAACELFPKEKGCIGVLLGRGNNAGDGLAAGRLLLDKGYEVCFFHTFALDHFSEDAKANYNRLQEKAPRFVSATSIEECEKEKQTLQSCQGFIDALFGTGLKTAVSGHFTRLIEYINELSYPVISIDVPSGLSADTGEALGSTIYAARTVTLGLPKVGLFCGDGPACVGKLTVADIGIPKAREASVSGEYELITPESFQELLRPRKSDAHKGNFGHFLVIAGHKGMLGAGYLTSRAALHIGAGLVSFALPKKAYEKFDARYPELICHPVPDGDTGCFHPVGLKGVLDFMSGKNSIAVGPGIGVAATTKDFVREALPIIDLPLVLDADGLNCLGNNHLEILKQRKAPTIITPHPGEMARLTGKSIQDIQEHRIEITKNFSMTYNVYVVLKGASTVIATPQGKIYINPTGNPGMATAGTGDVLTGVIAGLLAQGYKPELACIAGVYLHGLAGDIAAKDEGEISMVASDVINRLSDAIRQASHGISA
ncbi:MAG: bifunctional ADP-dependent NAD(P)H-hydrate dehydratase/NAD(P)H-hydrate epimerase [Deltaproteobacteria bacterium CG_4_10_14_0_2_um_filter_43_8]|nr:MAG: bifunctional ADP-dependent NAD(P)H-hydrate dehydratase/NAD(P)H-hydrate epimerase [Deltaproteobacteria bacterium CG11_big_fil_rev_8_21_14_0_20_42_23]PJA20391.1 MAG: bifunctional ADP-dependent NAD(P)H-hydrate dehydratase/NAD(P)H-hydrate epimerase [Deltaproteobacteria bacterium CG_4_10_14_0_2_um_filter_43_8]PJC63790.1 MAG: bifunctional ADP-dependent NAD(P)H-hydrate dehydratase/NAD(P)H-hydrate epimerase [Deltaproteobacteria bacterium CG_4_9_14_0_2_um_filter_42_21]